jgi:hypothetical protein
MTFLPVTSYDAVEFDALRDDLAPLIGDRAVALFGHAISQGFGGALARASRDSLLAGGDDPDAPQVTEAEQLLIDWGHAIGQDPRTVPAELDERLERVFSPASRVVLVAFASRVVAANTFAAVGRIDAHS